MKRTLIYLIFVLITQVDFGQDYSNSVLIEDRLYHLYKFTAPNNWVLENTEKKIEVAFGATTAKFFEQGTNINDGAEIMFRTTILEEKGYSTLDDWIKRDTINFKKNDVFEITDAMDILIDDRDSATCVLLKGVSIDLFMALAYIDAGKTGIQIWMLSKSKEGFYNSLNAFENLVKSYSIIETL
jgi:hypothetical protein